MKFKAVYLGYSRFVVNKNVKKKEKIALNKRAKMTLYRSPDYQTSLSQLAFGFKRRSSILIFKMVAILDFQSERF